MGGEQDINTISRDRRNAATKTLKIIIVILIGGLVATLVVPLNLSLSFWLTLLFSAVLFVPPAVKLIRGRFDLFEPVNLFIMGMVVFFLGPAWAYLVYPDIPDRFTITPVTMNVSLTLLNLGVSFFYIGYLVRLAPVLSHLIPTIGSDRWFRYRTRMILSLYFILAIALAYSFATSVGGVVYFLTHIAQRGTFTAGSFYLVWGFFLLIPVTIMYCYFLLREKGRTNFWFLVLLALTLLIVAARGLRADVLSLILALIIIHHYVKRRIKLSLVIFAGGSMLLFTLWFGLQRAQIGISFIGVQQTLEHYLNTRLPIGNLGVNILLPFAKVLEAMPEKLDFQWGVPFLSFLTLPIPRGLWPGKPIVPMAVLNRAIAEPTGLGTFYAYSVFGELYSNFHLIGIVIGMFLIGMLFRSLYSYSMSRPNGVLIYAAASFEFFMLVRGGLSRFIPLSLMKLIPIIIALFIIQRRKKRDTSQR